MMKHSVHYNELINSHRWHKVRARYMASKQWQCEECAKEGRVIPAEHCHHIVPLDSIPDKTTRAIMAYQESNLMALCSRHHDAIHKEMGQGTKQEKQTRDHLAVESFVERMTK